ncbi:MAG TPA: serine hydrolase domain-containing protein [Pyrinomonadaceae bacterium]|nr:serine hydrolase domain-containing protein [Pyrinomonadaceae bacterium]
MNPRFIVLLSVILLLTFPVTAQGDQIDAYIKTEMAVQHIPGLSLCVVQHNRIVKDQTYGLANVELNVPATADTEFAIASMTKSVTASAIMLLVQDGKISLEDPISKYFDGLPESWQAITIRQLLSHTSGIKDHFRDYPFFPPAKMDRKLEYTDAEFIRALVDGGLNFKPGAQWAYSGTGFTLLGEIITKVAGKPYSEFFRERIFVPLGMTKTHVISLTDIIPHRAAGYRWLSGTQRNGDYTGQTFSSGADVSLLTTAADLAKWNIALSSEGLWKKSSLEQMWTPANLANGEDAITFPGGEFGLGWFLTSYNGYRLVSHSGSFMTGFTSFMARIPDKDLVVIVLTNQHSANPLQLAFGLLGFYDAGLVAPHQMKVQPDTQPELTAKVKAFMTALFSGGVKEDPTKFVTPGLAHHLPPIPKPPGGLTAPLSDISFISSDDIRNRSIERYGSRVARMSYYKALFYGDPVHITFYFAADGQVADYSGY